MKPPSEPADLPPDERANGTRLIEFIEAGGLDREKPEWLTEAHLTRRGPGGFTALHAAAKENVLGQLPAEWLTTGTMGLRNDDGFTPFHIAALHGHLEHIPRHAWKESLIFDASIPCTVLHLATLSDSTGQFPRDLQIPAEYKEDFPQDWWEKPT